MLGRNLEKASRKPKKLKKNKILNTTAWRALYIYVHIYIYIWLYRPLGSWGFWSRLGFLGFGGGQADVVVRVRNTILYISVMLSHFYMKHMIVKRSKTRVISISYINHLCFKNMFNFIFEWVVWRLRIEEFEQVGWNSLQTISMWWGGCDEIVWTWFEDYFNPPVQILQSSIFKPPI